MRIPILTIHPQWASAIFSQGVRILNTKPALWLCPKLLGIYASDSNPPACNLGTVSLLRDRLIDIPTIEELRDRGEVGAIIGTVKLGRMNLQSEWRMCGMFSHEISCVQKLANPVPVEGHPWLWDYDLEEVTA